jgi:hypothetical protein
VSPCNSLMRRRVRDGGKMSDISADGQVDISRRALLRGAAVVLSVPVFAINIKATMAKSAQSAARRRFRPHSTHRFWSRSSPGVSLPVATIARLAIPAKPSQAIALGKFRRCRARRPSATFLQMQ